MNGHDERDIPDGLDHYLDQRLDEPARAAFAQRLAQDAALRAQVEGQEAIDAALRRRFALDHGAVAAAVARLGDGGGSPIVKPIPSAGLFQRLASFELRPRHLAAAAILLLVGVTAWWFWPEPSRVGQPYRGGYAAALPRTTALAFYRDRVERGFKADWVCPPDEFEQVCAAQLRVPLSYVLSADPAVNMVGVSYGNIITHRTLVLQAMVEGQPVMVLIDRLESDSGEEAVLASSSPTADSGADATEAAAEATPRLNLHRAALGSAVLYELTPLDKPRLLELFVVPPDSPLCN